MPARIKLSRGILIIPLILLGGCSSYSEVGSEAYQYSKAVYSTCNLQNESRLAEVAAQLEQAQAESKITEQEAEWLNEIIATAKSGDWQTATANARRLMESQIEGR